jgi:tRNA(Ile)-lysidine synthase
MYHIPVERLQQAVLHYIRKHALLHAGDRVGVAVSGGADSVSLLRLLLELRSEIGLVLSVAHFNHQLRAKDSDDDERFVAELARAHGLELHRESCDVKVFAAEKHLSLEAAARECRYEFFRCVLLDGGLNRLATAHTLDDQAETVLLRLVRGAGNKGLSGILPRLDVSKASAEASEFQNSRYIVRPLLGTLRRDLEQYLTSLNQSWREDRSNRDLRHSRNIIRHGILPRLERNLNPAVRETLAETAQIARDEESYWRFKMHGLLPEFWRKGWRPGMDANVAGQLDCQLPLDRAIQRRIVRTVAESLGLNLEFKHVEEIVGLTAFRASGAANLPGGWTVRREHGIGSVGGDALLFFRPAGDSGQVYPTQYERPLQIPGCAEIPEADIKLEAILLTPEKIADHDPDCLVGASVAPDLLIRNWRPGDRFWPAHTKAPKKVKELLGEQHITGTKRETWPVLVSGNEVVWVRGFRTPKQFQPKPGEGAILIRDTSLLHGQSSPDSDL